MIQTNFQRKYSCELINVSNKVTYFEHKYMFTTYFVKVWSFILKY